MREQFVKTVTSIGKKDNSLVVLTADISHYRLEPFAKACPGRYYNVGICENTMTTMASGLRMVGLIPVIHSMTPFVVEKCYEQIKLDLAHQELGCNIVTTGGAFDYSTLGATHHCYTDFALLKPLPNTNIFCPGSKQEFDQLFRQVYKNNKINYFRLSNKSHSLKLDATVGNGVLVKEGSRMTVIVTGGQLDNVVKAVGKKDVEIIYIHTIKPLDCKLIAQSIQKTKNVLVVEEHSRYGGLGDEVLHSCNNNIICRNMAIPETFIREYGSYEDLCKHIGLTEADIRKKINAQYSKKL